MPLKLDLNCEHQVSPVTDGSELKSPSPRKKPGLTPCSLFRFPTAVLTVRLPMSPEAANEKLAEDECASGMLPSRNENEEKMESNTNTTARAAMRLIGLAVGPIHGSR